MFPAHHLRRRHPCLPRLLLRRRRNVQPVRKEADIEKVLKVSQLGSSFSLRGILTPAIEKALAEDLPPVLGFYDLALARALDGIVISTPVKAWASWVICGLRAARSASPSASSPSTTRLLLEPGAGASPANFETGAATNIIYGLALGYKSAIRPIFGAPDRRRRPTPSAASTASRWRAGHALHHRHVPRHRRLRPHRRQRGWHRRDVRAQPECARDAPTPWTLRATPPRPSARASPSARRASSASASSPPSSLVQPSQSGRMARRPPPPAHLRGLLSAAMLPYWFSAMTMKSVGKAAECDGHGDQAPVRPNGNLLIPNHPDRPDYDTCIKISTDASLREMIAPGALAMLDCPSRRPSRLVAASRACSRVRSPSSASRWLHLSSNRAAHGTMLKKYLSKGAMAAPCPTPEPEDGQRQVRQGSASTSRRSSRPRSPATRSATRSRTRRARAQHPHEADGDHLRSSSLTSSSRSTRAVA